MDSNKDSSVNDVVLQILLVVLMAFSFYFIHDAPKKLFSTLRNRNQAHVQANHHFVRGAQILAKARASPSRSSASSLAKQAQDEARQAIALDPTDAAAHLLIALALDLRGLSAAAIDSLDAALSPALARSLSDGERADALVKRAELRMTMGPGQRGRADPAMADLQEALRISPKNAKALFLLGKYYEGKKMEKEAIEAYMEALKAEPQLRTSSSERVYGKRKENSVT
ncbi:hypothetical protein AHAS_Ahas07G0129200 [Arachis hypogaea]